MENLRHVVYFAISLGHPNHNPEVFVINRKMDVDSTQLNSMKAPFTKLPLSGSMIRSQGIVFWGLVPTLAESGSSIQLLTLPLSAQHATTGNITRNYFAVQN
jgi:hypothetical protein